ncbi:MAG TPA: cell division topological specificity factor MinE [Pseudolabrys sp.]|nr:cell division topological specificity factor MinE [Pseudolabrys sp.]
MNLFGLFRRGGSAPVARDRLQVLLSYERSSTNRGASDLLFILRDEILATVGRHVDIDPERVTVQMDRGEKVSVLEVDIEIPNSVRPVSSAGRKKRMAGPAHRPA